MNRTEEPNLKDFRYASNMPGLLLHPSTSINQRIIFPLLYYCCSTQYMWVG